MNGFLGSSAVTISEDYKSACLPRPTVCQLIKQTKQKLQAALSFVRYHGSAPDNICIRLDFGKTVPIYSRFTLYINQQDPRPCQNLQFKMVIELDGEDSITIPLSSKNAIHLPENVRSISIVCERSENAGKTNTVTFKVEPCV